jgi:hypothetical protein
LDSEGVRPGWFRRKSTKEAAMKNAAAGLRVISSDGVPRGGTKEEEGRDSCPQLMQQLM